MSTSRIKSWLFHKKTSMSLNYTFIFPSSGHNVKLSNISTPGHKRQISPFSASSSARLAVCLVWEVLCLGISVPSVVFSVFPSVTTMQRECKWNPIRSTAFAGTHSNYRFSCRRQSLVAIKASRIDFLFCFKCS